MSKIMMFDVESDGLYGEGFAVGAVVALTEPTGACTIIERFELMADTNITNSWVKENVLGHLGNMPKVKSTKELRTKFYEFYMKNKPGCLIYSDCNYPVETNFLSDIVKDDSSRSWDMPFPLMDCCNSDNIDISRNDFFKNGTSEDLKVHNPLDDAKASLYFLTHHYTCKHMIK
jgi:hypothetical protein